MIPLPLPRPARVAILGVGNELNGDDGAGVRAARALASTRPPAPGVLVIDAGTAPESFTGPLRRFAPDLVVEIDAADQGMPPGFTSWIDWSEADGLSASTHTLPPSVLATFLSRDLGCRVALVGVQPARLGTGGGLSPAVEAAVAELAAALRAWLAA